MKPKEVKALEQRIGDLEDIKEFIQAKIDKRRAWLEAAKAPKVEVVPVESEVPAVVGLPPVSGEKG